ncbi:MAG: hypothetical protein WCA13_13620 [Terriglobales bacterium]
MHDSADLGKMAFDFFEVKKAYSRENQILRSMLQEQGLSLRRIQAELRRRLKRQGVEETAVETLVRCAHRIEKILEAIELSERTTRSRAKTERNKMN